MTWTGTQDFEAQGQLQRLDPATGAVLNTSATITADYMQIHMAVDQRGVLYVSNGNAGGLGGGMLYSFNPDLTERWSMPVTGNLNQGAPVLATDGTLIVASTDTYLRAYRTPRNPCDYDFNQDENVDLLDAQQMAQVFVGILTPGAGWLDGDLNNDENADLTDAQLLAAYVVSGNCGV
jgi:outer membrane protein assembly factor BamB